jgi:hypothetical protein
MSWDTAQGSLGRNGKTTSSGQLQVTDGFGRYAKNPLFETSRKRQGEVLIHLNVLDLSLRMKQKVTFN